MLKGQVVMLEEAVSTQDAAIEHALQVGDVCWTSRQTGGRGRRGKTWSSEGGVAVTVVLNEATPHLPIAVAALLAARLNHLIPKHHVGIKWPNDLYVEGKKLVGILIEQRRDRCLVGVGVNVESAPLPSATALHDLGAEIGEASKSEIASLVADAVIESSQLDENTAVTHWSSRDILVGTQQRIQSGKRVVSGIVRHIDPCHNLILQTEEGIVECEAATSTVINPC